MNWSQLLNTAAQVGTGLIGRAQSGQQVSAIDFVGALVGGLTNANTLSAYQNQPYNGGLPYGATPPFVPVSNGYTAGYPQQTSYTQPGLGYPTSGLPQTTGNITQFGLPQYSGAYGSTLPSTSSYNAPTTLSQRLGAYQSIDGLAGLSAVELKAALEGGLALYGRTGASSTLSDVLLANGLGSELAGAQAYLASAEGQALAGLSPIDQLTYAMVKLSSGSYTGSADLARLTASLASSATSVANLASPYNALGTSALGSTLGTLPGYQNVLAAGNSQVPAFVQQLLAQYYPQLASQLTAGLPTSPIANTNIFAPTPSTNQLLSQLYPQYAALLAGTQQTTAANPYAALFGLGTQQTTAAANPYAALFGLGTQQTTAAANPYAALFGSTVAQSPLNALLAGLSSNPYAASLGLGTQQAAAANPYAALFGLGTQQPATLPSLFGQPQQINGLFNAANTAGAVSPNTNYMIPSPALSGDALIDYAARMMLSRVQSSLVNGAIPNSDAFRALFVTTAAINQPTAEGTAAALDIFNKVAKWDGSISLEDLKSALASNLPLGVSSSTLTPAQLQQWLVSKNFLNPETYLTGSGTLNGAGTIPAATTAEPTAAEKANAVAQSAIYLRTVFDSDGKFASASFEDLRNWVNNTVTQNPAIAALPDAKSQAKALLTIYKMFKSGVAEPSLDEAQFDSIKAKNPTSNIGELLATYFIQRNDRTATTTTTGPDGQSGTSTVGTLDQTEFTALWYGNPTPCNCDTPPVVPPVVPPVIPPIVIPPQPQTRIIYVPVPGQTIVKETIKEVPAPQQPVVNNNSNTQTQNQQQSVVVNITMPEAPKPVKKDEQKKMIPNGSKLPEGPLFTVLGDPHVFEGSNPSSDWDLTKTTNFNIKTTDGKFVPISIDSKELDKGKIFPTSLRIPLKDGKILDISGIANDLKNKSRDGKLTANIVADHVAAAGDFKAVTEVFEDATNGFATKGKDGANVTTDWVASQEKGDAKDASSFDKSAYFELVGTLPEPTVDAQGKRHLVIQLRQGNNTYELKIDENLVETGKTAGDEVLKNQTSISLVRVAAAEPEMIEDTSAKQDAPTDTDTPAAPKIEVTTTGSGSTPDVQINRNGVRQATPPTNKDGKVIVDAGGSDDTPEA